jgi:hypothetical protein
MPIQFQAGQPVTADDLQDLASTRVLQGAEQTETNSITLIDTSIVVPISDLTHVFVDVRYTSTGGGIRWTWRNSGSITTYNRSISSAGDPTTGTNHSIANMRLRQIATLNELQQVPHFQNASTHAIWENLVVEGEGDIILQFSQQTANAGSTAIHANSYALYTRLA